MGNFLKTKCLALLERFRAAKAAYITRHEISVAEAISTLSPVRRSDWIGSMSDSIRIVDDIISPANEECEWEVLRD
jgi:hypothetical protein